MIRYLYAMQDNPDSPLRIRAVWLLEHANHNDSALLNEETLRQHFTDLCRSITVKMNSACERVYSSRSSPNTVLWSRHHIIHEIRTYQCARPISDTYSSLRRCWRSVSDLVRISLRAGPIQVEISVSVLALDTILDYHRIHPRCAILIEPILFDRRIESDFIDFTKRVHRYNKKREHTWQSIDEAMAYHIKRPPWDAWDLDVLRWTSVSNIPRVKLPR